MTAKLGRDDEACELEGPSTLATVPGSSVSFRSLVGRLMDDADADVIT